MFYRLISLVTPIRIPFRVPIILLITDLLSPDPPINRVISTLKGVLTGIVILTKSRDPASKGSRDLVLVSKGSVSVGV